MKVELDTEEVWELMSLVVGRMLDEASLPERDRSKVRRWRSDAMQPGGDAMALLTRKVNEDIATVAARKRRSRIRKPDWR
ncbi:MAG: hypothetical protein WD939_00375 [Dehalococcoidia bacterium]